MNRSCINCKHCIKQRHPTTLLCYYGFICSKKNKGFNYNLLSQLRCIVCPFYESNEEGRTNG